MAADELNKPLGLTTGRKRPRSSLLVAIGAGVVIAIGAAAIVWVAYPGATGPTATAAITAPAFATIMPDQTGSTTPDGISIHMADPTEIGMPDDNPASGEIVIHDPANPPPIKLAALPDMALIENTEDGPLPRMAQDGTRPIDAYARPNDADPRNPRIVIVVGGIGIDPEGTRHAIAALPGAVTLAFAPYGDGLAEAVAAARNSGHELLLQVPLEPFNYPMTDPGPNTLTAKASADENIARLHWFLGRLTNYVGVVNYMGARFTGETKAMAPVMAEIGKRGLLYLDDGSSPRSKAADAAAAGAAPFVRADMVLDVDLSAAAIDRRLGQLQTLARERGYAVATATAFPVSIDRIAAFVEAAAGRGISIVPVSAMVASQ